MACQKVNAVVLLLCTVLIVSQVGRSGAGQNCFCECMKKCIPVGVLSVQECAEECDEACRRLGFDGEPRGGMEFCRKLGS
ncbi:hypothetical protein OPV22_033785 [Ensete ventricosum]|uniref:Uncharacterized protein n=1 Tax=Ensete ventricosum TaxID=4639 RepID=A0AAV8Q2Z4_ENSVE|nr:hypothetical protein OPV22_033785 [Ensete ventricosum]RWV98049.1 hypothetical protein GW17_00039129 [Ensete ventricosum]